jgi:DUF1680 family protein
MFVSLRSRRRNATCAAIVLLLGINTLYAVDLKLVPEKVPPAIPDRQDSQIADVVHLTGWIGTRISANETNRMVRIDPDRLLEGYRKRPGRQTWDGEHVGKWLHAATLAWANSGDPKLRGKLDYTVAELVKCQLADGYLGTYVEADRWTNWDVWAHKYNLIGLITYMRHTGNMEPLPACRRMADLLCNTFGDEPGKRDLVPAGQHMGMAATSVLEAMVLLYRLTGEARYLDFCKYILRAWEQPNGPKVISTLLTQKRADKVGNGKAYEMLSCLNGALELYRVTGDQQLLQACLNAWQDIVDKRLYITGTASYREFFHDDHDLPNINNVGETCVTVTWLQFNTHLLRLTGEARFAEQIERTTLNQLFGAQCPDGSAWGYYVQMEGKKPYNGTLDGHCCVSSGPRGIALLPTSAWTCDAHGVVLNLYDAGKAMLRLRNDSSVELAVKTQYPASAKIEVIVSPEKKQSFDLRFRIPAWCDEPGVEVNGKQATVKKGNDGYAMIQRIWEKGDKLALTFPLKPRVIVGERNNEHRVALMYGPLVLAADEALLENKEIRLRDIGIPGSDLASLGFSPQPASEKWKTWPAATLFKINAVAHPSHSTGSALTTIPIRLVPFADAGASGTPYKVWLPYKAPRQDRNLLIDGIEIRSRKPNMGSIIDGRTETVAVTFNGKKAPEDWFGVQLEEPVVVQKISFAHGKTFHDGGWFDVSAGKPRVQIKTKLEGEWETVGELAGYPSTNARNAAGLKGGESFDCELSKPTEVFGVRIVGKPASGDNPKQAFASCGELEAR